MTYTGVRVQSAAKQVECFLTNDHVHTEGTSRLPLALGAVTNADSKWRALDLIPHSPTLATAVSHISHGIALQSNALAYLVNSKRTNYNRV